MDKLLKNLEFSEEVYSIADVIKDFTFPAVIKAQSTCLLSDKITVQRGDVITVHGKKNVTVLKGKDCQGRSVDLVSVCPYQVQLALPEEERVSFSSLKELCAKKDGRPKFVQIKVEKEHETENAKNGDRLKVLLVEQGANGPLNMHFRNEKGKHIRLPVDLQASFSSCPADSKEYFISEIANIYKAPLALCVEFIPCEETTVYSSLGVIEIIEQSSIELLYITLKDGGKTYCCVNLSSVELIGNLPKGFVNKAEDYKLVEKAITELVNVDKFDAVVGSADPLEWNPNFHLQFDKVFAKKKKEKLKRKDAVRFNALEVENDENLSDASSESSKTKKRFTFFKDNNKAEKKSNWKKEANGKAANKTKNKGKNKDESGADDSGTSKEDLDNVANQNEEISEWAVIETPASGASAVNVPNVQVLEIKKDERKISAEEKKKLKLEVKKKEKMEKKEKEKKDKKVKKMKKKKEEKSSENNIYLSAENLQESEVSAPNSPNSYCEDDYEMPIPVQGMNKAAQEAANNEKPKTITLISRTWKKMKKRRRALSDASAFKDKDKKNADLPDCPPPLMDPDYEIDGEIYEQIPGEFMSTDIYEEAVRAYGAYETPVSPDAARRLSPSCETGDSGFDEIDQKAIENWRDSSAPPPLPGNHPKMCPLPKARRGSSLKGTIPRSSLPSIDSEGFRKFYEGLKASEAELRGWGPDEIEQVLKDLQLHRYNEKFIESQVDGSLLIDLDEAVLRDLGLNLFEARKLRKFVFGWRPDANRARNHYDRYEKASKNPSHWDTATVSTILRNQLGMNDFAKFCAENQVNGDLLRDIVADEDLLKFLLAGKDMRLNSVKLKNFVLEGWRPKKKSVAPISSQYEEPVISQNSAPELSYLELSPITKALQSEEMYEIPASPDTVRSFEQLKKNNLTSKSTPPVKISSEGNLQKNANVKTESLVGSAGGVNSLMQRYETKTTSGVSSRAGVRPPNRSPQLGVTRRISSTDAPNVANMKKRFGDK